MAIYTVANIILGLTIFGTNAYTWRQLNGFKWRWIKLAFALVGLAWTLMYLFLAFAPIDVYEYTYFTTRIMRPAVTMTLSVMLWASIIGALRKNCHEVEE